MRFFFAFATLLLTLCACVPGSVERKVFLNIYSTAPSGRQFEVLVRYGKVDSASYRLIGTDAKHDSLLLDSGPISVLIESNHTTLFQSLRVTRDYAEPTVDVYYTEVDSSVHGSAQHGLSVFHYDKGELLFE